MKVNGEFIIREILGDYVLIPVGETALNFSGMITTNELGTKIWQYLKEGKTEQEILLWILNNYETDSKQAENDLNNFISILDQNDLITK